MTSTAVDLAIRPLRDGDEAAVITLLNESLGGGPAGGYTTEFFRWKHRDNPFGVSPGLVAEHDGRIVGVRLFLKWTLRAGDREVSAVRAVDTATHPSCQGMGIFRRLTLGLLGQLDVDLVFNTPNGNSRPGYLKMGWLPVGTLPVRICPTRPLSLVRGARAAVGTTASATSSGGKTEHGNATAPQAPTGSPFPHALEVLHGVGGQLEELLGQGPHDDRLHTPRSLTYLTWRYGHAPELDYRAVPVESRGRLVGVAFGRTRCRGPLTEFTVADVLVRSGDRHAARRVLAACRQAGTDHVAVHAPTSSEIDRAALRAGYLRVPRHGIDLVANPRRDLPVRVLDTATWRLCLGDLEVF